MASVGDSMSEPVTLSFTCADHTQMPDNYVAWHAHADELKRRRYKQRRCGECGLWAIVLAHDGRLVESSGHELKRLKVIR